MDDRINITGLSLDASERQKLLEYFPEGIVALDMEFTGLSPLLDKIIEIGAVILTPDGVKTLNTYIDPEIEIPEYTRAIHGINNEMVKGAPTIEEYLPSFIKEVGKLPMLAHNASYDLGFLIYNMHTGKLPLGNNRVLCSCQFSRAINRGAPGHNLQKLCDYFEINLEDHHQALTDAMASLKIFARTLMKRNAKDLINKATLFKVSDFGTETDFQLPRKFRKIIDLLPKQEIFDLKYRGGSHKGKFRPVRPVSILPLPKGNVLYAHCLLSDQYKSFAIKKVSEIQLLNQEEKKEREDAFKKLFKKDLPVQKS